LSVGSAFPPLLFPLDNALADSPICGRYDRVDGARSGTARGFEQLRDAGQNSGVGGVVGIAAGEPDGSAFLGHGEGITWPTRRRQLRMLYAGPEDGYSAPERRRRWGDAGRTGRSWSQRRK